MSKLLPYLEMTMLAEDSRPEWDVVMCSNCQGTGKEKWGDIELSCSDCYGTGRITMRRKRALLDGKY